MGWMNGASEEYDPGFTRFAKNVELRPATQRKTSCYWVKLFDVEILFSYRTAMAFNKPGEGWFRREDGITSTTKQHLRETNMDTATRLTDEEFDRALGEAMVHVIARDAELCSAVLAEATTLKLVGELA